MSGILAVSLKEAPGNPGESEGTMNHGVRIHDARHPNFCRDLVVEPLGAEEWASLQAWQEAGETPARALKIPSRRCVVCGQAVPLLRRMDSTTCSARCASTLRQRVRRKGGLRVAGRGFSALEHADSKGR